MVLTIIGCLILLASVALLAFVVAAIISPSILKLKNGSTPSRLVIFFAGMWLDAALFIFGLILIGLANPLQTEPKTSSSPSHFAAASDTPTTSLIDSASNSDTTELDGAVTTLSALNASSEQSPAVPEKITKPYDIECKVVGISDGDTLTCLEDDHNQIKVRLNQIDAPEKKQDFGNASKKALSAMVFGKVVGLKTNGTDKYRRTLAEVFVDGVNVNKEMVRTGYAWAYKEYLQDNEYIELEKNAQSESIGLWSVPDPIYPSDFRHGKKKPQSQTANHEDTLLNTKSSGFSCSGKRFCREMDSCDEAKFYLNQCGVHRLDGDNDGIPCEKIC